MTGDDWFYKNGTQWVGPVSEATLAKLLASKALSRETVVRVGESEAWTSLSESFDFARYVPPPLKVRGYDDWFDTAPHPWRRYFARMLDITLLGAMSWMVVGIVLGALDPEAAEQLFQSFDDRTGMIFGTLFTLPLSMIWTTIFLGLTGTTPGKLLFGIRILDQHGMPPGIWVASEREARVWLLGLGCGIPFVSLATLVTAFSRLTARKRTRWDEDLRLTATHRANDNMQTVLNVLGVTTFVVANIAARFFT